ncbi:MAG: AmmeMemoRadiSam system radical SAM enzyme [Syntrophobacterales bacterium]|jgi:pyruvate formate lyase activating enzyme|nr:AmmeMemoRadiSam system radical SAM enzyme [Syntrophobacterales bacterium]
MPHESTLYEKLADGQVRCHLCAHFCVVKQNSQGICGVRENRNGCLYSLVYGKIVAENVDPIEKKPLFHVLPGSKSYSVAAMGCNFHCSFCQNHQISQIPPQNDFWGRNTTPDMIVAHALATGCQSIAYTYTEPTVYFEFAHDCCRLAHEKGVKNVFISNGYMSAEALEMISPYLDAINVDLKAFSPDFYKKQCGAFLQPVLDTLSRLKEKGIWVEVTTLLIPALNDAPAELAQLAAYIYALGPETPWHISRFHPDYKLRTISPTPVSIVQDALKIGKDAGLYHVYSGNIPGERTEKTFCRTCGHLLIDRIGFSVRNISLLRNACPNCQTPLDGLWAAG